MVFCLHTYKTRKGKQTLRYLLGVWKKQVSRKNLLGRDTTFVLLDQLALCSVTWKKETAGTDSAVQQNCQQDRPDGKFKELRHSSKQEIGLQSLEESAWIWWSKEQKKGHKVESLCDWKGSKVFPSRCLPLGLKIIAFASVKLGVYAR